jgi:hypothetical protein
MSCFHVDVILVTTVVACKCHCCCNYILLLSLNGDTFVIFFLIVHVFVTVLGVVAYFCLCSIAICAS